MKIIITLEGSDITQERLDLLKALSSSQVQAPVKESAPPEISKSELPQPQEVPQPQAPEIKKTDLRAAALKLSKAGKRNELSACFQKFGKTRLSDFDDSKELWGELLDELRKADGDA